MLRRGPEVAAPGQPSVEPSCISDGSPAPIRTREPRLLDPADPTAGARQVQELKGDSGAATVRIFGLLLTLIAVAAFCSVAIDLVAIQCFRENVKVCAPLPGIFDWLGQFDRDSRAALLGTLPIITILVLYVIGRSGRVRFEERVKDFAAGLGDTEKEPGRPLLATRGFWSVSRTGQTSEWLHVAASVDLVLLLLALDSAYVAVPDCFRTSSMVTQDCIDAAWGYPLPAWFVIGALVLMTAIVVLVWLASHTPEEPGAGGRFLVRMSRSDAGSVEIRSAWKRGAAMTCLVLAISGYLAWTILAFTKATADTIDGPGYLGLTATPIVLVVLALFLALAGTGWRAQPRSSSGPEARESRGWRWLSAVLLVLGVVALVLSHLEAFADWRWVFVGGAAALVVAHLVISWSTSGNNKYEAWRGQGPAVVMLLALFASMALSSLLVLGAASWLGGPVDAAPADQARWNIPDAYERFAVLLTLIALLLLLLLRPRWHGICGGSSGSHSRRSSVRDRTTTMGRSAEERGGIESADLDPKTYASRLRYPDGQVRRRGERPTQFAHAASGRAALRMARGVRRRRVLQLVIGGRRRPAQGHGAISLAQAACQHPQRCRPRCSSPSPSQLLERSSPTRRRAANGRLGCSGMSWPSSPVPDTRSHLRVSASASCPSSPRAPAGG